MVTRSILLALMFLLLQRSASAPRPETYRDPEAYAVYTASLNQVDPKRPLIILGETVTYPRCFPKGAALTDKSWAEAAQHYLQENKTPKLLVREFQVKRPYVLLPMQEWKTLVQQSRWEPFWQRFGERSGHTAFSAVGFDRSRTKALLYSAYSCGSLCGEGSYKLFTKFGGRWRSTIVNADVCDWIS
jgi:hypothetical protein